MTAPWLEIIRERLKYLKAHPSSRIITASNIQDLLEAIEKKDEALREFAKCAEWASASDTRACGIGCDMGDAGGTTIDGHDYDCHINNARKALNFDPTKGSEK